MIIVYEQEIKVLEDENVKLKEEITFLHQQLQYKTMGLPMEDNLLREVVGDDANDQKRKSLLEEGTEEEEQDYNK
tara:strand:- start:863 stop:1087 length:225 start_codon:yes stop_codon:yes gene_type:complete